jgi:hypothetical protein
MISPRWSTLASGLVLVLALGVGSDARAQHGVAGMAGPAWGDPFGGAYGFSPYGYGAYGGLSPYDGGYGGFTMFPMPGFAESLGVIPQTTFEFPGLFSGVTSVRGWDRPTRSVPRPRVRRRR